MSDLDWAICDVEGNVLEPITQRISAEVEIELNGPRSARVVASVEEEAAAAAVAFGSTIKVWMNNHIIFNGPMTLPRWLGEDRGLFGRSRPHVGRAHW